MHFIVDLENEVNDAEKEDLDHNDFADDHDSLSMLSLKLGLKLWILKLETECLHFFNLSIFLQNVVYDLNQIGILCFIVCLFTAAFTAFTADLIYVFCIWS